MSSNGMPPMRISVPMSAWRRAQVVGGRRAEDRDAQALVDG